MIRIAVCDDNNDELKYAERVTHAYFDVHNEIKFEIKSFNNPLSMIDFIEKNGSFDLFVLDICMNGISGLKVAQELKMRHDCGEIIFMTSSRDYAVEAFALNAIHYLVKPFSEKDFFEAMDRAIQKINTSAPKYLIRNTDKGVMRISLNSICYSEASGHYQYIHLNSGDVLKVRSKTNELWEELKQNKNYIKPHSGYVVNMDYVKNVTTLGMNIKDINIPITKNTLTKVKKTYLDYVFNSNNC